MKKQLSFVWILILLLAMPLSAIHAQEDATGFDNGSLSFDLPPEWQVVDVSQDPLSAFAIMPIEVDTTGMTFDTVPESAPGQPVILMIVLDDFMAGQLAGDGVDITTMDSRAATELAASDLFGQEVIDQGMLNFVAVPHTNGTESVYFEVTDPEEGLAMLGSALTNPTGGLFVQSEALVEDLEPLRPVVENILATAEFDVAGLTGGAMAMDDMPTGNVAEPAVLEFTEYAIPGLQFSHPVNGIVRQIDEIGNVPSFIVSDVEFGPDFDLNVAPELTDPNSYLATMLLLDDETIPLLFGNDINVFEADSLTLTQVAYDNLSQNSAESVVFGDVRLVSLPDGDQVAIIELLQLDSLQGVIGFVVNPSGVVWVQVMGLSPAVTEATLIEIMNSLDFELSLLVAE